MTRPGSIDIVGGGPAGLYTAILARRLLNGVRVRVFEQNPAGATFGFGVVFSDRALDFLADDDPETHALITPRMEQWANMTLNHPRGAVTLDGVGFSALGRLDLLDCLRERALALGVHLHDESAIDSTARLDADVVVGADGLNSLVRREDEAAFGTSVEHFGNHFAWFGVDRPFDTLTQTFIDSAAGPLNAHHYRYTPERSTFIVECAPDTHARLGLAELDEAASAHRCAELFAPVLDGQPLLVNRSTWRQFPRLWCERWVAGNRVLVGDAAHTAHFSIGSGTRLAMEDAIALVSRLVEHADWREALAAYQAERPPVARKIVDAANTSALWYESFGDHMRLQPLDFAYSYITRSGRVDDDRLRKLAPGFMAAYDAARSREVDQDEPTPDEATPVAATASATVDSATSSADPVALDAPGSRAIGFERARHSNCSAVLWDNLGRAPDKLAVTGPGGDLTYRALIDEAARWGNAFARLGLARGARIPMLLDDTPAYPAAFFGAVRAGFVPVLLNTLVRPDALNYYLRDCDATVAVCDAELADLFDAEALAGTDLKRLVVVNGERSAPGPDETLAVDEFLNGMPTELAAADTAPTDMAFWMYSSGSTGRPKGIVHLHHDMAFTEQSYGRRVLALEADDRCFSVPRIFFAYGFGNAFTFPFSVGATTVLMPGRQDPQRVLETIAEYRPTVLFGLPTLYTALCHAPGFAAADLSSLRLSISAAEVLSEEIYRAWQDKVGHGPTEGLGSTELLHIYLSNHIDDHRPGAAGAPVPGYEVRLVDMDGAPVAAGEEGVMQVRGDSSTPGYWNKPDKTAETVRADWIHTGDRFIERDGYYYFQGRADDLIKVSGQWVWPLEVERCLNEHAAVHECAVLAHELPDRRMTLRAVVTLRDGASSDDAMREQLKSHVKTQLLPFKYPRIVEFVSELPKTGTGKLDRQALKAPTVSD